MANCFKTQLKSVVQNDNLDYMGYLTIKVNAGEAASSRCILVKTTANGTAYIKGGKFLQSDLITEIGNNVPLTANSYTYLRISSDECIIYLPKYMFQEITFSNNSIFQLNTGDWNVTDNFDNWDFCKYNTFSDINLPVTNIDFSKLPVLNANSFALKGTVNSNSSEIANVLRNCSKIDLVETSNSMAGDISAFSICSNLTLLRLFDGIIGGEIVTLAEAMKSNRTDGDTLKIVNSGHGTMKVNGTPVANVTITFNRSLPNGYSIS